MVSAKYNLRKRKQTISIFRGINQSINTSMSRVSSKNSSLYMEFKDTRNVTLDDYPATRTRDKRQYAGKKNVMYHNNIISNILACDRGIIRLENSGLLYVGDSETYPVFTNSSQGNVRRTLIEYGNEIVILPDKLVVTIDRSSEGLKFSSYSIENRCSGVGTGTYGDLPVLQKTVRNTSIEPAGYVRQNVAMDLTDSVYQTEGENSSFKSFYDARVLGDIVESTRTTPSTLYMVTSISTGEDYSEYFSSRLLDFTIMYNTYTRINMKDIGRGFRADDWVKISGCSGEAEKLNSSYKILECGDDYIVINCELDTSIEYSGEITVERSMPCDMDFVIALDNRLWGCSSKNNRIYASRLGDPTNWEAYGDGISTDSYWVDVSTEGEFTGISVGSGAVYFFKENCIHKVAGTKPKNYYTTTYKDMGVQKGSDRSVVWIKDRLFYHSPAGICVYSPGGEPSIISESAFGKEQYIDAVAGGNNSKYYVSLRNLRTGEQEVYVYDTECGYWIKEDTEYFSACCTYNSIMYFVNDKTGYMGCISDAENNLLRKSFEDYSIEEPDVNIGETVDTFYGAEGVQAAAILGDIDGDGIVTRADALALRSMLANMTGYDTDGNGTLDAIDCTALFDAGEAEKVRVIVASDVKRDGVVNIRDATMLEKWLDQPELYNEDDVEFLLESGDLYDSYSEKTYIQKLELCVELGAGAELTVEISKNRGYRKKLMTLRPQRKNSVTIPIRPGRCDYFSFRLSGRGEFVLYSVTITTEGGSTNNVRI